MYNIKTIKTIITKWLKRKKKTTEKELQTMNSQSMTDDSGTAIVNVRKTVCLAIHSKGKQGVDNSVFTLIP